MPAKTFNHHCPDWAEALLNGFSQVFLQRHPFFGLLCLLAILMAAPTLLGGALLGAVGGLLTAQCRGYAKVHRQAGLFSYNGILLGLLLSQQLPWSPLLPPLIIASSGLSAILTQQWLKRARPSSQLPAYTAPFVGLAWLLLTLSEPALAYSAVPVSVAAVDWLGAVFMGFGQVMFLDQPLAGALIASGLWVANRRAATWALAGSVAGLAFTWLHHENASALQGLGGYNSALAALALSQVTRRPWLPLLGIALALLVTPGFSSLGLPTLTAPFILACWLARAGARVLQQAARDSAPCATRGNPPRLR